MIIYEGPSRLDNSPIVVIATKKSSNAKTGNMIQTWILRSDMQPSEAVQQGKDDAICGDCPARPIMKKQDKGPGDCYVTMMAPAAIYKTYKAGKYDKAESDEEIASFAEGRVVRLGAYGDPAAAPASVWSAIISKATGHTGYTHQWKKPAAASLKNMCMASCDDLDDFNTARADGWRTFRVARDTATIGKREFRCPSDPLLKTALPCEKCKACNGADPAKPKKASPYIVAHGYRSKKVPRGNPAAKTTKTLTAAMANVMCSGVPHCWVKSSIWGSGQVSMSAHE